MHTGPVILSHSPSLPLDSPSLSTLPSLPSPPLPAPSTPQLNKRRSDIISKNGDIISKHRLSSGGADLDHAPKEAHYYVHTDTEHIASQLDALQEEQIAALHAQLRQEKIARGVAEEREAASAKEKKDLESQIRKLEDNLERARDTTTGRKAAQKLRKLLGEQDRAIELLCQYVDAHDVMAALTEVRGDRERDGGVGLGEAVCV